MSDLYVKRFLSISLLIVAVVAGPAGCAAAVIAGAAAAGGYIAHQEGYRVRNPFTKSGEAKKRASDKD